MKTLNQIS